jgi:hypothetical protein
MTTPALAGSAATTTSAGVTSPMTLNLPASIAAGDLLVCQIARRGGSQTYTFPAGWVQVSGAASLENAQGQFDLFYKIADGTEGATISVSSTVAGSNRMTCWIARFTGADNAGTPVAAAAAEGSATDANPDPPNFAPGLGARDFLWFAVQISESTAQSVTAYPTNYTGNQTSLNGALASTTGMRHSFASRALNASSEDPGTFTMTASIIWKAKTFAIIPPASATTARNFGSII